MILRQASDLKTRQAVWVTAARVAHPTILMAGLFADMFRADVRRNRPHFD
jgi:hypothetical protein